LLIFEFARKYASEYMPLIESWVSGQLIPVLNNRPNSAGYVSVECVDGSIDFSYHIGALSTPELGSSLAVWSVLELVLSGHNEGKQTSYQLDQDEAGQWHTTVVITDEEVPEPAVPPSVSEEANSIISSIFSHEQGWATDGHEVWLSPSFPEIAGFSELLARQPSEQELQSYLEEFPKFLLATCGFADSSVLALLRKPPVGTAFVADFAVLAFGQGGFSINLFEIEDSHSPIFTRQLAPAKRFQSAITQVTDWSQWISGNYKTFVDDCLRIARNSPHLQERGQFGSFRLRSFEDIHQAFLQFGSYEYPAVNYKIILGRWALLSDVEKKRFIFLNTRPNINYHTYTYEQLLRDGFVRPYTSY